MVWGVYPELLAIGAHDPPKNLGGLEKKSGSAKGIATEKAWRLAVDKYHQLGCDACAKSFTRQATSRYSNVIQWSIRWSLDALAENSLPIKSMLRAKATGDKVKRLSPVTHHLPFTTI